MYRSASRASPFTQNPNRPGVPSRCSVPSACTRPVAVGDPVHHGQVRGDRLDAEPLGRLLVHERGVEVADLLRLGAGCGVLRRGGLDDLAQVPLGLVAQQVEGAVDRPVLGDLGGRPATDPFTCRKRSSCGRTSGARWSMSMPDFIRAAPQLPRRPPRGRPVGFAWTVQAGCDGFVHHPRDADGAARVRCGHPPASSRRSASCGSCGGGRKGSTTSVTPCGPSAVSTAPSASRCRGRTAPVGPAPADLTTCTSWSWCCSCAGCGPGCGRFHRPTARRNRPRQGDRTPGPRPARSVDAHPVRRRAPR